MNISSRMEFTKSYGRRSWDTVGSDTQRRGGFQIQKLYVRRQEKEASVTTKKTPLKPKTKGGER